MKLIRKWPIARFARPPVRPRGDSCVHRIVRWSPGTAAPLRLSYHTLGTLTCLHTLDAPLDWPPSSEQHGGTIGLGGTAAQMGSCAERRAASQAPRAV